MSIIAEINDNSNNKIDASIGLLANVPQILVYRLLDKLNIENNGDNKIEIIILYRYTSESAKKLVESLGGDLYDLEFNFALVNIPADRLQELSTSNEIQYIELPKSLYENDLDSNRETCVLQASSIYGVTGKGVIIGFIDSGIDYTHPSFMDENGDTRIEYIYDASNNATYNKNEINDAIKSTDPYSIVPERDDTGHGTHVAGIACSGGKVANRFRGAAPEASIIMVKGRRGSWVLSTEIMRGIKFLLDKSKELDMPIVINISLSTNNGAHNGKSLLEQYISAVANLERVTIVIAAGNEGDSGHHVGGKLNRVQSEAFNIASDERTLVMNVFTPILSEISINIIGPTGQRSGSINLTQGYFSGNIGKDRYDVYVSGPQPFELESETQIILSAISSEYLVEGTWNIEISVTNNYQGEYSIWLPISEGLNPKTRFLNPSQLNTLGIPATVSNIIAVGSYNARTDTLSTFSGRGSNSPCLEQIRPDIAAPGEEILGPLPGGGYDTKTGTSMATPQVAGICALFTEWGIVKGNDPYLFGQRLKYYLVKGAKRNRSDINYPNSLWGYGTICASESFSILNNDISGVKSREEFENNVQDTGLINNNMNLENSMVNGVSLKSTTSVPSDLLKLTQAEDVNKDEILGLLIETFTFEDLQEIKKLPNTSAVSINETYSVVRIPLGQIPNLVKYIKKIERVINPELYTLTALSPVEASGVALFNKNPYISLDGTNVLVGIVDTGIDYLNREFMREDDTTRILRIWDQTINGNDEVEGIRFGTEYTEDDINQAITLFNEGGDPYTIVPSRDEVNHGTMSAGIIGGRGMDPDLIGAAPNCDFVVVKVSPVGDFVLNYAGVALDKVAYGNVELILAVRYLSRVAARLKRPMVIYFPFGTNIGAHDGTSIIENLLEIQGRRVGIVATVGTGNQGDTQTHIQGKFETDEKMKTIQVKVGKNQHDLNLQIYCQKPDKVNIGIVSPSGEVLNEVYVRIKELNNYKFIYEGTTVDIIYLFPDEANSDETIIIRFKNIREGTWQIRLYGEKIVDGRYWAWMPQRELLDEDTRFFDPIQRTTLTIPATARGVVATAFYNQDLNSTVTQSGRGYTRDGRIKPDIVAGGVNALVPQSGGGTTTASGSSVATSVLAGCCAIILQWAIVEGNDPDISARKVISYIIRGAKMRQGDIYPNIDWGYGILDIRNIFDSLRSEKVLNEIRDNINLEKNHVYTEFNKLIQDVQEDEYLELNKGNLFFRIPKINY